MSISAYVGLPGHGKSYGAVQNVIIPALKKGRVVYTNIPMNLELLTKDFGSAPVQFTTAEVIANPNWFTEVFPAGSVLVFDECMRLWPSGLKANNALMQHHEFLTEHRHFVGDDGFSTEIYLVTQDLSQIANFVRALVETTYRMVKLISIGMDKRFRVDIYEGSVTGSKPPASKRIREIHGGKFSKDIWNYYKSHTKSDQVGNESRTDSRNNALAKTSIKIGIFVFIVCLVFAFYGFGKLSDTYSSSETVSVSQPLQTNNQNQSVPVQQVNRPQRPEFLAKAKQIFISHTIKTNGLTETFFSMFFDDSYAVLSSRDLQKLGYKVMPFNQCLILVEGLDYSDYVMCRTNKKSTGFIKAAISGEES